MNDITRWFGEFSWAKLAYSVILVALIVLLVTELRRLWWDPRIYVGKFQVFAGSEEQKGWASAFAVQVIHHHRMLIQRFADEKTRRAAAQEPAPGAVTQQRPELPWWPHEVTAVNDPRSTLSDLELSVQGVNVKEILAKLRQWISAPNEVMGFVDVSDSGVRATVIWPHGPSKLRQDRVDAQSFDIETRPDASSAAFQVACGLVWAQAANKQQDLAAVSRTNFCNWTEAWVRYLELRDKSTGMAGLIAEDIARLKQLRGFLDRMAVQGTPYPEILRLRADVIDFLPVSEKTPEDIVQAQEDRTAYARATLPKQDPRSGLLEEILLASGRPALNVASDRVQAALTPTWQALIESYKGNISAAVRATGYGRIVRNGKQDEGRYFCGFVVGPNLILTTGFGVRYDEAQSYPEKFTDRDVAWFSFDEDARDLQKPFQSLAIEEIVYATHDLALLRFADHNVTEHPPLELAVLPHPPDSLKERYVFVVGYPTRDGHMDRPAVEAIFGDRDRMKHVSPGRILSVTSQTNSVRNIACDATTTGGSEGGPLIDLVSGRVLTIHAAIGAEGKGLGAPALQDLLANPEIRAKVGPVLKLSAP